MANAASGLTVRRYDDPADDPRLLQLLEEAFGGWPAGGAADAAAHLRWKLHSRPEATRSHVVAEIDGRIVGAVFYLVQEVKVGDRLLHARQGIDACISPGYRKRGVMAEIRRFSWELDVGSFDLQFGPTGHRAVIRLDDREGAARFAEHVDVLRHPLERSSPADDAQPGAGERLGWTIRVASRFDERIGEFWAEASQPFDFIVVRTKDYLNWRRTHSRGRAVASNRTLQKDRATLHAVFAFAEELELREGNPVRRVSVPKADPRDPVILSDDQYERVLSECAERPMLSLYVLVLGETGARCESEALYLRWEDVDFEGGFLRIASGRDGHRTKSGKGRWVPMTPELKDAVREHFARFRFAMYRGEQTPWVFHHPWPVGGPAQGNESSRYVERLQRRPGGRTRARCRAGGAGD
ncbi:MAG: GNAT family N-acetyltransferase [Chloroflexi bacterium]|nr:GNAT family N-acetyltransferase [Chloroflexota bacterium]